MCFEILDRLRSEMHIPVWHDDQQGAAGVILAGLFNALELTGRTLQDSRIVLFGAGAANVAAARLLFEAGANPANLIVLDSKGILHPEREDIDQLLLRNRWKYELAIKTNGALWEQAGRFVDKDSSVLVLDDTTLNKPYSKKIALIANRWSGKHRRVARGVQRALPPRISVFWHKLG
jgi:malic enzyme